MLLMEVKVADIFIICSKSSDTTLQAYSATYSVLKEVDKSKFALWQPRRHNGGEVVITPLILYLHTKHKQAANLTPPAALTQQMPSGCL